MEGQLDDTFEQAADYVATHTASLHQDGLLHLYGLYKQATEGPCSTTKPAFWDLRAKSKWNAWSKLGAMTKESAMRGYVECLNKARPGWDSQPQEPGEGTGKKSGMGPVFSTMAAAAGEDEPGVGEQGPNNERNQLHALAGAGDIEGVQALLDAGTDVDVRDDQGCTALHFAADRGCVATARQLLGAGAQVNAQDDDGGTPLHYAALCGNQEVAIMLKEDAEADVAIQDTSGQLAKAYAPYAWAHLIGP
ncbi:ankyrin repeat-containing domain protein [Dunaliella salina]|uniref:Ankyrin repeat-containing domain protein n=1 Tax=Dunaliella salina TaxID=3046 RepID=A0ABQ7H769_DUNSA|nr:ankyrin repeat-containing domain protein [Dunaliella salina]|eukprot:KAF5842688.1 ankyrin repeat-containing domain protein [Dunaliella salina]